MRGRNSLGRRPPGIEPRASPPRGGRSGAKRLVVSFPESKMASVWAILTATRRHIGKDNFLALAGGAAFQALLTLFPALTAVVSVYGLVADPCSACLMKSELRARGSLTPNTTASPRIWFSRGVPQSWGKTFAKHFKTYSGDHVKDHHPLDYLPQVP